MGTIPVPAPLPAPEEGRTPATATTAAARPRVAAGVDRLGRWTKILSAYFSAQGAVQLLGAVAGLLFVNFMRVEEFALYTLAFSVVSFFHFLTDLGSTGSLVHFFHKTAKEGGDFGGYVAAVTGLRRTAFLLGAVGVAAAFPPLAMHQGFPAGAAGLATAAIIACVWFQIVSSLRLLVLRLEQGFGRAYRAEIAGGLVRLLLAGAMVISAWLEAWLALLASAAAVAVVSALARPAGVPDARSAAARHRREVLRYLVPILPSGVYFAIQAPLLVWLCATFGSTAHVAEVGALSRLGMLMALLSGLVGVVFMPRLAQLTDDVLYRRRCLQYGGLLLVLGAGVLAAAAAAPDVFLFLLGPHYQGLRRELLLLVAGTAVALLSGYTVTVSNSRAWTRWQAPALVLQIGAQIALIAVLPLDRTAGVLLLGLLTGAVGLTLQLVITFVGFRRPEWVQWR